MTRKVAILMGSPNDKDKMARAADTLTRYGIEADVRVMSAHRTPAIVADFATTARDNGYAAIICGAGMAAHLAGAVAESMARHRDPHVAFVPEGPYVVPVREEA